MKDKTKRTGKTELSAAEARAAGQPDTFKHLSREEKRAVVNAAIRDGEELFKRIMDGGR